MEKTTLTSKFYFQLRADICHLFILLIMLTVPVSAYASSVQGATSQKHKTRTASSKSKKAKSVSSSQKKQSSQSADKIKTNKAAGPRQFNGELMYRQLSYMNNLIKNLSFGMGYNGEKSVKVIVKGKKVHIHDQSMHQHMIILEDKTGFIYNDVTKEGLSIDSQFLSTYFDGFDLETKKKMLDEQSKKTNIAYEVSSDVHVQDNKVAYKGDQCKVKSGQVKIDQSVTDVEAWYSDNYKEVPNMKFVFMGLDTPGIIKKALITSQVPVPLFGTGKTAQAYELVAVSEFNVSDSDFQVPAEVKLEKFKDNGQYVKFMKNSSKALKKAHLYPESKKRKDVKLAMESDWDFVSDWLDRKIEFDDRGVTWAKVGEALLTGVGAVVDIALVASGKEPEVLPALETAKSVKNPGSITASKTVPSVSDSEQLEINGLISRIADESYALSKKMKKKDAAPYIEANDKSVEWLRNLQREGHSTVSGREWREHREAIALEPVDGFSGGVCMYGTDVLSSPTAVVYRSPLDNGDGLYIPHHIKHCDNKIAELKEYESELKRTGTYGVRQPRYLSSMDLAVLDGLRPRSAAYTDLGKLERQSAERAIVDMMLKLSQEAGRYQIYANQYSTNYYPSELLELDIEYGINQAKADKERMESNKKFEEERMEINREFNCSKIYQDYENMLDNEHSKWYLHGEYPDWKWVREIQDTMKELRERGKLKSRSKWEDWSKDYDPMKD